MKDYLWVFVLTVISLISASVFLLTIGQSTQLIKKLKFSNVRLISNFILLLISLVDMGLIIYVFMLVKTQIDLLS